MRKDSSPSARTRGLSQWVSHWTDIAREEQVYWSLLWSLQAWRAAGLIESIGEVPVGSKDGVQVPRDAPGLGVSLDEEKLAAAAEAYERRGERLVRDDVGAMLERDPDWLPLMPKW